jgi:hypothetical protein
LASGVADAACFATRVPRPIDIESISIFLVSTGLL